MSLLTIIQDAAISIGIARPSAVIGSSTREVAELLVFAQEEGKALMRAHEWQELRKEKTFTSVAAETQTNAIPTDFDRFVDETFWNRTKTRPLYGPLSSQEWQNIKGNNSIPYVDNFTYRGSNILITPAPTAGQTLAYEYISKNWCESSGGTEQDHWAADDDVGILNEELMRLGIIVRFKSAKGLAFDIDLGKYKQLFSDIVGKNRPKRRINMARERSPYRGIIGVQEGSWDVT